MTSKNEKANTPHATSVPNSKKSPKLMGTKNT